MTTIIISNFLFIFVFTFLGCWLSDWICNAKIIKPYFKEIFDANVGNDDGRLQ